MLATVLQAVRFDDVVAFGQEGERTGALVLGAARFTITAHLIDGSIVGVSTDDPCYALGPYLVRHGVLEAGQLAAAERLSRSSAQALVEVLITCAIGTLDKLEETRLRHALDVLLGGRLSDVLTLQFEDGDLPEDGCADLELSFESLAAEAAAMPAPPRILAARAEIGATLRRLAATCEAAGFDERAVLEALGDSAALDETCARAGIGRLRALLAIESLEASGLICVEAVSGRGAPKGRSRSEPEPLSILDAELDDVLGECLERAALVAGLEADPFDQHASQAAVEAPREVPCLVASEALETRREAAPVEDRLGAEAWLLDGWTSADQALSGRTQAQPVRPSEAGDEDVVRATLGALSDAWEHELSDDSPRESAASSGIGLTGLCEVAAADAEQELESRLQPAARPSGVRGWLAEGRRLMDERRYEDGLAAFRAAAEEDPLNQTAATLCAGAEEVVCAWMYRAEFSDGEVVSAALERNAESGCPETELSPLEAFLLSRFHDVRDVKEVASTAPLGELGALRVLRDLKRRGYLSLSGAA